MAPHWANPNRTQIHKSQTIVAISSASASDSPQNHHEIAVGFEYSIPVMYCFKSHSSVDLTVRCCIYGQELYCTRPSFSPGLARVMGDNKQGVHFVWRPEISWMQFQKSAWAFLCTGFIQCIYFVSLKSHKFKGSIFQMGGLSLNIWLLINLRYLRTIQYRHRNLC